MGYDRMRHRLVRFIIRFSFRLAVIAFLLAAGILLYCYAAGPPPLANEENTIYYSENGETIGEEKGTENRKWVRLENISPYLIEATLLTEDRGFYHHFGFDLKRIIKAVIVNLQTGTLKEGASTLTQQYARNLYLSHEKTWLRKIKEAFYTIQLEMHYSKEQILEGYLNTIYYGHGAYGIEAASRHFFNKSAGELTLAESTMLAGIPKGPTYYSPLNDEENAENRQEQILAVMKNEGAISEQEYITAQNETLEYQQVDTSDDKEMGPYFQDIVLDEASNLLQMEEEHIRTAGYHIHTTLDTELQQEMEQQLKQVIDPESDIQIGTIAMDPKTGAIRALAGGKDYTESPYNRAIYAKRMPASTFKPILYYAALENGYTASTMLESKPTSFTMENGEVYEPSNFNGYYAEKPISLATALAVSDNIYAVKTNMYLGPEKLVEYAREFHITSELDAVPSLALGTSAVTLKEMVTAYSMIANGGKEVESYTIEKIVDQHGNTIYEREEERPEQVLNEQSAFILTQLMTGMFDRELNDYMSVTGAGISDQLSRAYAGKSGTTGSDSWMIGFSPSLVTGVWTGYDDNRQIESVAETTYAKNIWAGFMEAAHQEKPEESFPAPPGVVAVPIDPKTGKLATPYCDVSRVMYFKEGTEPREMCTEHYQEENPEEQLEVETEDKGIIERWLDLLPG